jgi:hypothetical protein
MNSFTLKTIKTTLNYTGHKMGCYIPTYLSKWDFFIKSA